VACPKASALLAGEYLCHFWDYDRSEYIQGKLARKASSIGRTYAKISLSWVKRYIVPEIGSMKLSELKPGQIERILVKLKTDAKLNPRTINYVLQSIKVPLTEAHRLGLISVNPTSTIKRFGVSTREKGILTSQEVRQLFELSWPDPVAKLAFKVAVTGGLRLGEVQALTIQAIKEDHLVVAHSYSQVDGFKGTKTNRIRYVPLPASLLDELRALHACNASGTDWVFWSPTKPKVPLGSHKLDAGLQGFCAHWDR